MARSFWPLSSPLGARINGAEIVGVVPDVRFPGNPAESGTPYQTYRPFAQEPRGFMSAAIRGDLSAETLRRAVADVDPDQPVGQPGPVRAEVGNSLETWATVGRLLSLFALAAFLVATTLFACWVPARRAARVDPMVALQTE